MFAPYRLKIGLMVLNLNRRSLFPEELLQKIPVGDETSWCAVIVTETDAEVLKIPQRQL